MTESYIHQIIPQRIKELDFTRFHERHRDFVVEEGTTISLSAYNELYFIVDDPHGIVVESDYGLYDSTDDPLPENVHEHRGEIVIRNPGAGRRRVKFIQVIIVN